MFNRHKILCIIIICIAVCAAACKSKDEPRPKGAPPPPVAEAKQTAAAPTLAPPPPPTPQAAAQTAPAQEPPKGPVTILPSVEAPAPPAAQIPATPPTIPYGAALPIPGTLLQQPVPPIGAAMQPSPSAPVQPESPATGQPAAIPSAPPAVTGLAQPMTETSPPPEHAPIQAIAAPEIPPSVEEAPKAGAAPEEVAFEPKLVRARTDIEVILDASGSMAAQFGTTTTSKFDIVKDAFYNVLSQMVSAQQDFPRNMALRVFGSKSPASDEDRDDTELLIGMGDPQAQAIRDALGKVEAKGTSPITKALTDASKDFPAGSVADRLIVLIADGGDNTGTDPCEAVSKIEQSGDKIQIHVVAFDVKPEDVARLECIAKNGDGKFYLARNENELRAALEQAVNSTVPYNLKLNVTAGAAPLPFSLKVQKAGTTETLKLESGYGTKLLQLNPGSYDLAVEYSSSPEARKPAKILKGVNVLAGTKVEQTINFDLGEVSISALGNEGNPAAARISMTKTGFAEIAAEFETDAETKIVFVTPAIYDITAELLEGQIEGFTLADRGVEVKTGETTEHIFRFQKGSLSLKGMTTQKQFLPFIVQVYKAGRPDALVASGAFSADGGAMFLAPGIYDLIVIGMDPQMVASPRTKITDVNVKSAETTELAAIFEMGTIKLSAIDAQGTKLAARFILRDRETQIEMANMVSESGSPIDATVPPGTYDIVASSLKSALEPKPSVLVSGVVITANKPAEQAIKFVLGTLRIRGRGVKEQSMLTQFTLYKAGTDEQVTVAPPSSDWTVFDVAPGKYDALAVNLSSLEKPQPMIWLRDLKVEEAKSMSLEAIFTAGKLKIIGRGPNNKLIKCHFKVFQYGSDRELINGETGEDWEIFEIQPGKYYLEAAFHDDEQSVMLKKWINISVGENEVVEEVLRF